MGLLALGGPIMTVISRRIIAPQPGAADLAAEQARKMCELMNQAGAKARAMKVIMGADAGTIEVFGRYENFTTGAHSLGALSKSPEVLAIRAHLEVGLACDVTGPYVYRTVFGELTTQPIVVQRMYQVSRTNLKAAVALLPEAKAAFPDSVGMAATIPVFSPEMDRLVVSYYVDSLDHLGKVLDEQVKSEAYQAVLVKAAQIGDLMAVRALAPA
jgi:hypothetical protein